MRTLTLVVIGLVVLAACAAIARLAGRAPAAGARWFLLFWLAASLVNLYLGVSHGYTLTYELPFFALMFGVPALAALAVMRWRAAGKSA
jgi:hypothetical protein